MIEILEGKSSISLIPQLINLQLVRNTGAAFSLFSNSTSILGILSLVVSLLLIICIRKSKQLYFWQAMGSAFLLGGCLGNGIDRWRLGYVNDFIELVPINFPIFNIAHIAINIAVFCLIIETISKQTYNQRQH